MNPVFFAFEHFDAVGAHRELDNGYPIDTAGSVTIASARTFEFTDSAELVEQMGSEPAFTDCLVSTAVAELVGLSAHDSAVQDYVARAHVSGDGAQLLDVLREFIVSEHFRFRRE
jgi:hypothetical protein